MVMALDGMVCSPAPQIVYSSAVLIPVSRIAPLRTVPRTRRRAVPEQEFPPLRPPARSFRHDRDDEDPPPWADLPPVRPARSHRPPAGGNPAGPGGRPGGPGARAAGPGSRRVSDPGQDEPVPQWAQWDGPEADGGEEVPSARPPRPARVP